MDPRAIREKTGLGQEEFWLRVGVTQSGGSRYEAGRRMPKPVEALVRLLYVEQIDLEGLTADDVLVARYLRVHFPEQYRLWRKAARALEGALVLV